MRALALTLIFSASLANAGDTFSHALQGFMVHAAIAKVCGASKPVTYVFGATGAVLGAYPDLAGAYGNIVLHDRWATYGEAHDASLAISYIPAVRLHLIVDQPFHSRNGGWVAGAWMLETAMIITEGILFYLLIKWIEAK